MQTNCKWYLVNQNEKSTIERIKECMKDLTKWLDVAIQDESRIL